METPVQPAPQLNDEADGAANTLTTTKKIEVIVRMPCFRLVQNPLKVRKLLPEMPENIVYWPKTW